MKQLARCWTSTSACMLPAWQKLFNALLILARTISGNVISGSNRIPGSGHTAASATIKLFPTKGPRCLPNSSFFSSPHCEADTLHWSDPLRTWKLWKKWFSHSGHCLTPVCVPSLRYWWWIWTGLLHERPIKWQDWQDIELAQVLTFFQHGRAINVRCSAHSCLNRNRQPDYW